MIRSSSWMLIGTSAVAAASAWLFFLTSQWDGRPGPSSLQPELVIKQPRWSLFDEQGHRSRWLSAQRLEQWAGEQAARVIQPQLQIEDKQQREWIINSAYGRIYKNNQSLLLERDVVVQQSADNGGLTIKTERLHIAGSGTSLETDAPVALHTGSWHFASTGMRANLDQHQLELLTRVRVRHE